MIPLAGRINGPLGHKLQRKSARTCRGLKITRLTNRATLEPKREHPPCERFLACPRVVVWRRRRLFSFPQSSSCSLCLPCPTSPNSACGCRRRHTSPPHAIDTRVVPHLVHSSAN